MKTLLGIALAAVLVQGAALEKSRVSPDALQQAAREFDKRVQKYSIDDPFVLLGGAHGLYLDGVGAVITAEVNLAATAITPFRPQLTPEEKLRLRDKKSGRVVTLKELMLKVMVDSAGVLQTLPPSEQVVLGVTLTYFGWENREGLPNQLVMQTARQNLLDFRAGRIDQKTFNSRMKVREIE